VQITSNAHGLSTGNRVRIFGVILNKASAFPVDVKDENVFFLPQDVQLIAQQLDDWAFWSEIGAWEDDFCCCSTGSITEATNTNPVNITSPSHGLQTGDRIKIVRISGMTQISGKEFAVGKISKDKNSFQLSGTDGSFFTEATHESGDWVKLCMARSGAIQKVTMGTPIQITSQGHPLKPGDRVHILNLAQIPEISSWDKADPFTVDTVTADTFTLKGVAKAGDSQERTIIGSWIRILTDERKYSRVQGGIRIAMERSEVILKDQDHPTSWLGTTIHPTQSGTALEILAYGTLGCLAIDNATSAEVLLSNYHILYSLPNEDNVHHPDYSCCKSHKIGVRMRHADPGTSTESRGTADAAIAKLDDPGNADPVIVDIGPVKGTAPIALTDILADASLNDYRGYRVRKRGVTTLLTEGIIISLDADFQDSTSSGPIFLKNQIVIQPMAGDGLGAFVVKGDSGSAVVNDENMVVGLLMGGDYMGRGFASPIGEVETQLNIKIWAADPSSSGTNGDDHSTAGDDLVVTPSIPDLLAQVSAELAQTTDGAKFISLAQRHHSEVETLIHHNRRVTVAWHRNEGPSILRALHRFVEARDEPLPDTINGLSLHRCLENIGAALQRFGSPRLAADLERHGPGILQLVGLTYSNLVSRLATRGLA
jgi:hypothetical protein